MITGNEPAYPFTAATEENLSSIHLTGLTKREYFAAMAMQGLISDETNPMYYPNRAMEAVEIADKLINALNAQP